jgi:hypothetical protein
MEGYMASTAIEGFKRHWGFVHSMTLAFAEETPDEHWDFSPHTRFAPFSKQLRHIVCVRGMYRDYLRDGQADFARKHEQYRGGLSREELIPALIRKHKEMMNVVSAIDDGTKIEFMGKTLEFPEFAHVIVQHESIHLGQWSIYAALAGFETPMLWKLNWGL